MNEWSRWRVFCWRSGGWTGIEDYEWMKQMKSVLLEKWGLDWEWRLWMNKADEECSAGEVGVGLGVKHMKWRKEVNEMKGGVLLEKRELDWDWRLWMNEADEGCFAGKEGVGLGLKIMNEWSRWRVFCRRSGGWTGGEEYEWMQQMKSVLLEKRELGWEWSIWSEEKKWMKWKEVFCWKRGSWTGIEDYEWMKQMKGVLLEKRELDWDWRLWMNEADEGCFAGEVGAGLEVKNMNEWSRWRVFCWRRGSWAGSEDYEWMKQMKSVLLEKWGLDWEWRLWMNEADEGCSAGEVGVGLGVKHMNEWSRWRVFCWRRGSWAGSEDYEWMKQMKSVLLEKWGLDWEWRLWMNEADEGCSAGEVGVGLGVKHMNEWSRWRVSCWRSGGWTGSEDYEWTKQMKSVLLEKWGLDWEWSIWSEEKKWMKWKEVFCWKRGSWTGIEDYEWMKQMKGVLLEKRELDWDWRLWMNEADEGCFAGEVGAGLEVKNMNECSRWKVFCWRRGSWAGSEAYEVKKRSEWNERRCFAGKEGVGLGLKIMNEWSRWRVFCWKRGSWTGIEDYEWMKQMKGVLQEKWGLDRRWRIWMNEADEGCFAGEVGAGLEVKNMNEWSRWRVFCWRSGGWTGSEAYEWMKQMKGALQEKRELGWEWRLWMNEADEECFAGEEEVGLGLKITNEWSRWRVFCWRSGGWTGSEDYEWMKQMKGVLLEKWGLDWEWSIWMNEADEGCFAGEEGVGLGVKIMNEWSRWRVFCWRSGGWTGSEDYEWMKQMKGVLLEKWGLDWEWSIWMNEADEECFAGEEGVGLGVKHMKWRKEVNEMKGGVLLEKRELDWDWRLWMNEADEGCFAGKEGVGLGLKIMNEWSRWRVFCRRSGGWTGGEEYEWMQQMKSVLLEKRELGWEWSIWSEEKKWMKWKEVFCWKRGNERRCFAGKEGVGLGLKIMNEWSRWRVFCWKRGSWTGIEDYEWMKQMKGVLLEKRELDWDWRLWMNEADEGCFAGEVGAGLEVKNMNEWSRWRVFCWRRGSWAGSEDYEWMKQMKSVLLEKWGLDCEWRLWMNEARLWWRVFCWRSGGWTGSEAYEWMKQMKGVLLEKRELGWEWRLRMNEADEECFAGEVGVGLGVKIMNEWSRWRVFCWRSGGWTGSEAYEVKKRSEWNERRCFAGEEGVGLGLKIMNEWSRWRVFCRRSGGWTGSEAYEWMKQMKSVLLEKRELGWEWSIWSEEKKWMKWKEVFCWKRGSWTGIEDYEWMKQMKGVLLEKRELDWDWRLWMNEADEGCFAGEVGAGLEVKNMNECSRWRVFCWRFCWRRGSWAGSEAYEVKKRSEWNERRCFAGKEGVGLGLKIMNEWSRWRVFCWKRGSWTGIEDYEWMKQMKGVLLEKRELDWDWRLWMNEADEGCFAGEVGAGLEVKNMNEWSRWRVFCWRRGSWAGSEDYEWMKQMKSVLLEKWGLDCEWRLWMNEADEGCSAGEVGVGLGVKHMNEWSRWRVFCWRRGSWAGSEDYEWMKQMKSVLLEKWGLDWEWRLWMNEADEGCSAGEVGVGLGVKHMNEWSRWRVFCWRRGSWAGSEAYEVKKRSEWNERRCFAGEEGVGLGLKIMNEWSRWRVFCRRSGGWTRDEEYEWMKQMKGVLQEKWGLDWRWRIWMNEADEECFAGEVGVGLGVKHMNEWSRWRVLCWRRGSWAASEDYEWMKQMKSVLLEKKRLDWDWRLRMNEADEECFAGEVGVGLGVKIMNEWSRWRVFCWRSGGWTESEAYEVKKRSEWNERRCFAGKEGVGLGLKIMNEWSRWRVFCWKRGSWTGIEDYEWMKQMKGVLQEKWGLDRRWRIWMNEADEGCFAGEVGAGLEVKNMNEWSRWRVFCWRSGGWTGSEAYEWMKQMKGALQEKRELGWEWRLWMNEADEECFAGEEEVGLGLKITNEWSRWRVFCWRSGGWTGSEDYEWMKQMKSVLLEKWGLDWEWRLWMNEAEEGCSAGEVGVGLGVKHMNEWSRWRVLCWRSGSWAGSEDYEWMKQMKSVLLEKRELDWKWRLWMSEADEECFAGEVGVGLGLKIMNEWSRWRVFCWRSGGWTGSEDYEWMKQMKSVLLEKWGLDWEWRLWMNEADEECFAGEVGVGLGVKIMKWRKEVNEMKGGLSFLSGFYHGPSRIWQITSD